MAHRGELSHRTTGNTLADIILGGQDGMVNALGIILGVSAASGSSRIVIAGALAATFAESISMGAVEYTHKLTQRDHYLSEREKEKLEVKTVPQDEEQEIRDIYKNKGFDGKILDDIVKHVTSDEELWVDQMMRDELDLKPISKKEINKASIIVGLSAFIGSVIPVIPFFFLSTVDAMITSVVLAGIVLFIVGIIKAHITIGKPVKSGLQMLLIGLGAAFAGYIIGRLLG